jgi:hypothetical protein
MDRTAVLEKLEPISHVSTRPVTHSPRTRVLIQPGQVLIRPGSGGQLVPVSEDGVKALANFVGLPQKVCKELSPSTFGTVATELLGRKERYNLLLENDEVQNFGEYRGIKNLPVDRVLSTIEQGMPHCEFHRVSILSNRSAMLEVIGIKQEAVRRGDLLRAGAIVAFSPINTIMPRVQSYVLRMVCTNGMSTKTVLAEFTGGHGEGDDVWQFFRQSVRAAYQSIGSIVKRYQNMIKERIPADQRAGMLEELLRQTGITGKEAEAVRARAIQEPPRNSYEMLNLITWASSHIVQSPEKIQRAMIASATFTSESEHSSVCPLCHTKQVPH